MSLVSRSSTRQALIIALAVFGLLLLLQLLGPRPAYRGQSLPDSSGAPLPNIDVSTEFYQLGPLAEYEAIRDRPLFNSDRRPVIEAPPEVIEEEVFVEAVEPPPPVNVTLAGVIITPDRRMALVRDNLTGRTHRLYEGMPLEGQQAAWTLAEIGPRQIAFSAEGQDLAAVELHVNKAALPAAIAAPVASSGAAAVMEGEVPDEQEDARAAAQTRAEEIRRRIEERRAQMRAEAQRAAQGAKENE